MSHGFSPNGIVTLTTDFGVSSPYVAAMKGALLAVQRDATIVDLTHAVPPQDIRFGAIALADTWRTFPKGAVHVAVVDPGVGTSRPILAATIDGHAFVLPDNGLLSLIANDTPPSLVVRLTDPSYWRETLSATFHGRDIMAPVAGHLASGVALEALGEPTNQFVALDWPRPTVAPNRIDGQVIHIDAFGNAITNIPRAVLEETFAIDDSLEVECEGRAIALVKTYGDAAPGEIIALFGSSDRLEIATVNGSAAERLPIARGATISVRGVESNAS